MLCFKATGYKRECGPLFGGVSDIAFFDPNDFNLVQPAKVNGKTQAYSAITRRPGATAAGGANMYVVTFQQDEAELTWKQAAGKCSSKYDIELVFQIAENGMTMVNLLEALDSAGCCCGLAAAVRFNTGAIAFVGEKYVNGSSIVRFTMKQDGSDGTSGKLIDDLNGGNIHIKGSYTRPFYFYSADWATIEALFDEAAPATYENVQAFNTDVNGVATSGAKEGVNATASATNANLKLEYDTVTPHVGTPVTINITVGGVAQLTISTYAEYVASGKSFKFTDTAGVVHTHVWQAGTIAF